MHQRLHLHELLYFVQPAGFKTFTNALFDVPLLRSSPELAMKLAIDTSRQQSSQAKVPNRHRPKVEVASLPQEFGNGWAAVLVNKIHPIDPGQKLHRCEDGGDHGQDEEDVVLSICLGGPSELLLAILFLPHALSLSKVLLRASATAPHFVARP
eukprot:CAMPEP_0206616866 /NCGR_PEP_ID=MMETSP0325_2-20121206/59256_1 /ASSEMBLY_ACC=CAM_ASM_000347 /TAXON_ID=2866 /ORGANISM="Crypthecodinium cohnii, Strain Seligo" /LENGTH=153 /DNA_ID=CAMNT_0054138663 /DNA_START=177 /DNA_END=638 /DNA_ORIENTATION=+